MRNICILVFLCGFIYPDIESEIIEYRKMIELLIIDIQMKIKDLQQKNTNVDQKIKREVDAQIDNLKQDLMQDINGQIKNQQITEIEKLKQQIKQELTEEIKRELIEQAQQEIKEQIIEEVKKIIEEINPINDIPKTIWRTCWKKNKTGSNFFDFTEKLWIDLPHDKKWQYITEYQKWYAYEKGTDVEIEFAVDSVIVKMVLIPPGKFYEGEQGKTIQIESFWIGKYEVTQKQLFEIINIEPWLDNQNNNYPDYPANYITNEDIKKFLNHLGHDFSLPSCHQWEYACRSGTTSDLYWNRQEDILQYANIKKTKDTVQKVGSLKPNAFGLYDMIGNVYEWCLENENIEPITLMGSSFFTEENITCWHKIYPQFFLKSRFYGFRITKKFEQ